MCKYEYNPAWILLLLFFSGFFFLILKEIKLNTFVFVHRNPVAVVASGSVSPGRAPP